MVGRALKKAFVLCVSGACRALFPAGLSILPHLARLFATSRRDPHREHAMPTVSSPLASVVALFIAAAALPCTAGAQAPRDGAPASTPSVAAPLAWMAGCWEQRTPRRLVQELWLPPASGALQGMARTLRRTAAGDSLVEMEFLRIVARDGAWVYLAQPNGQPPTEFTAHVVADTSVAFTNLAHDFPQRIEYTRRGADSLVARVEGMVNGKTRTIVFPYARARCW